MKIWTWSKCLFLILYALFSIYLILFLNFMCSQSKSPHRDRTVRGQRGREENYGNRSFSPNKTSSSANPASSLQQSLQQQLENLKHQGTEVFLKSIETSEKPTLVPRLSHLQIKRNPHPPPPSSTAFSTLQSNAGDSANSPLQRNSKQTKKGQCLALSP